MKTLWWQDPTKYCNKANLFYDDNITPLKYSNITWHPYICCHCISWAVNWNWLNQHLATKLAFKFILLLMCNNLHLSLTPQICLWILTCTNFCLWFCQILTPLIWMFHCLQVAQNLGIRLTWVATQTRMRHKGQVHMNTRVWWQESMPPFIISFSLFLHMHF